MASRGRRSVEKTETEAMMASFADPYLLLQPPCDRAGESKAHPGALENQVLDSNENPAGHEHSARLLPPPAARAAPPLPPASKAPL